MVIGPSGAELHGDAAVAIQVCIGSIGEDLGEADFEVEGAAAVVTPFYFMDQETITKDYGSSLEFVCMSVIDSSKSISIVDLLNSSHQRS